MKISFVAESKNVSISIPSSFALGKLGSIVVKKATKGKVNLRARDLRKIRKTIKTLRKKGEEWYLVEIDGKDGQNIKIKL